MGHKRKSKAKRAPKRRQEKLATKFRCPFCNHDDGVDVRMNRRDQTGVASCRVCAADFSTSINALSAPIDVYIEWIDEWERVNEERQKPKRARAT